MSENNFETQSDYLEQLRDRFAAAALQGLLANSSPEGAAVGYRRIAIDAWAIAEEMMVRRPG